MEVLHTFPKYWLMLLADSQNQNISSGAQAHRLIQ